VKISKILKNFDEKSHEKAQKNCEKAQKKNEKS
jgi:restriction endonuclease S subunit